MGLDELNTAETESILHFHNKRMNFKKSLMIAASQFLDYLCHFSIFHLTSFFNRILAITEAMIINQRHNVRQ